MTLTFHRVAYEVLDICNGVTRADVTASLKATGLTDGKALDIGCGNGSVALIAAGLGLKVVAVERDPEMADLARRRVSEAGRGDKVVVVQTPSERLLADAGPFDLIIAMGATEPVGPGIVEPEDIFAGLAKALVPGGWLLWGDLTWIAEPPVPVRQITEISGRYLDDAGWKDAAQAAGLELRRAVISDPEVWDAYGAGMIGAAQAWLDRHPDHADAPAIRNRAEQTGLLLTYGRGTMGFGLYLFRRPA